MSIHDSSRWRLEYGRIAEGLHNGSDNAETEYESFLGRFFESVYDSLEQIVSKAGANRTPPLCIYPASHAADAHTFAMDSDGIHVGLQFVIEFDSVLALYAGFLLQNFVYQTSPIMGDVPPLEQIVDPEAFPGEALTMHAASLIPDAVAKDGYARTPADSILQAMEAARFASEDEDPALVLSRSLQKDVCDVLTYLEAASTEQVWAAYVDDRSDYILRLHLRLLHDAAYFMLAHELAHYLLGHHEVSSQDSAQSQHDEAEADLRALEILEVVPGFNPRSLLTVFAFCHAVEPDVPADRMEHPFARNRILILNDTILKHRYDERLREDINAGMSMMPRALPSLPVRFGWPDVHEDLEILPFVYSDLDQCAHLLLYLDRAPHQAEYHDGGRENAFVLALMGFEADVVLRDRIHNARIIHRGRVQVFPGGMDGVFIRYGEKTILTRTSIRIACLPEWWLGHDNTEFAIESLRLLPEPNEEPSTKTKIFFHLDPVDVDYATYLSSLPPPDSDAYAWANTRLAARRFCEWRQAERAEYFFRHLFAECPSLMLYPDLVDFAALVGTGGRVSEAGKIALCALDAGKQLRPVLSLIVAHAKLEEQLIPEALNFAFLEMCGIGKDGEKAEQAQALYGQILGDPGDPTMAELRDFHGHYKTAEDATRGGSQEEALGSLRQALESIRRAQRTAGKQLVALLEYEAETRQEILNIEGRSYEEARSAFERVLREEPRFVPARIQLARLALSRGDQKEAERQWQKAYELAPLNHFVTAFRAQLQASNPKFVIRSRPVEEAFADGTVEDEESPGNGP